MKGANTDACALGSAVLRLVMILVPFANETEHKAVPVSINRMGFTNFIFCFRNHLAAVLQCT